MSLWISGATISNSRRLIFDICRLRFLGTTRRALCSSSPAPNNTGSSNIRLYRILLRLCRVSSRSLDGDKKQFFLLQRELDPLESGMSRIQTRAIPTLPTCEKQWLSLLQFFNVTVLQNDMVYSCMRYLNDESILAHFSDDVKGDKDGDFWIPGFHDRSALRFCLSEQQQQQQHRSTVEKAIRVSFRHADTVDTELTDCTATASRPFAICSNNKSW